MKRFTKCASKLDFATDIDYALNYLKGRVKRINYRNFTMRHDGFDALDYEDN